MAQTRKASRSPSRKAAPGPELAIVVVEVPANWQPSSTLDLPPLYTVVDRDGPYDAQSVREIQLDFNAAEIIVRRRGRGANLWMLAVAKGGAA